jgi:3-oxoacyl-[acyl-carrier protein] reductase
MTAPRNCKPFTRETASGRRGEASAPNFVGCGPRALASAPNFDQNGGKAAPAGVEKRSWQWIWASPGAKRSSAHRARAWGGPARWRSLRRAAPVLVNGRDSARLEATAREIRAATGAHVLAVAGDLDSAEVRAALLEACPAPFAELTRENILRGLESNMLTPIALVQRVAPGMARRRFGRIVNMTSSSVRAPIAGLDVSSGARAGLTAFLAASARALAKDNVTINSIQPGAFDTDWIRSILDRSAVATGGDPAALRAQREAAAPAGRFGAPEEFGALCAFLCSAQAGYLTGQNILIDGGAFPGAF